MLLDRKHILLFAATVGFYFALASLVLNPFTFIESDPWISSLLVFLGAFIWLTLFGFLLAKTHEPRTRRLLLLVYLILASLLSACGPWLLLSQDSSTLLLYLSSFVISALLPIVVCVLWFIFDDLQSKITVTSSASAEEKLPVLKLVNDKGKVLFKVDLHKVLCFEANDNYVVTYYVDEKNGLSKTMERVSLKHINEIVEGMQVDFARVHKSYLVNPKFVRQVEGKSQAYRLRLEYLEKAIPVSRNFDVGQFGA